MESNFYSDEFEQLIREKTEQYKMYPSEKVWKGVHSSLHTKRRWFIMGMSVLVTGILFLAGKELIFPSNHVSTIKKIASSNTVNASSGDARSKGENAFPPSLSRYKPALPAAGSSRRGGDETSEVAGDGQYYRGITITISNPVISQPDLSEYLSKMVRLPQEAPALPVVAEKDRKGMEPAGVGNASNGVTTAAAANGNSGIATGGANTGLSMSGEASPSGTGSGLTTNTGKQTRMARNSVGPARTSADPEVDSRTIDDPHGEASRNSPVNSLAEAVDEQRINWLQDYAVYNLKPQPRRGRNYFQLYLSPTLSFRKLSGTIGGPKSPLVTGDIKDYVGNQDPAPGFQVGGSWLYRATRNLTFKAGLQFNFSWYSLRAYPADPQSSSDNPLSYYGYLLEASRPPTPGSVFQPRQQIKLNNDYYQLSAPIGFELRVLGNERLQLHMGATIQPSYLFNGNNYLLTPNAEKYIKEAPMYRKWNLSAGAEAFLSYRINDIFRLQIGPEFHYQLLSTYNSTFSNSMPYPIRENMIGYGIKIGITRSLP